MKLMVCGKCHSAFEKSKVKGIQCPKKKCNGILYSTDIETYPINKTLIDEYSSDYPMLTSAKPGYWIDSSTYKMPTLRFPVYLACEIPGMQEVIENLRKHVNIHPSGLFIDISKFLNNNDKSDIIYNFIKDYLIDYLEINEVYAALAPNSIDLTLNILSCIDDECMDGYFSIILELCAYPVVNENHPYKYIDRHPSYLSIGYENSNIQYETYILAKANILSQFYAWSKVFLSKVLQYL